MMHDLYADNSLAIVTRKEGGAPPNARKRHGERLRTFV